MLRIIISFFFISIAFVCNSQTVETPDFSADRPGMATSASIMQPNVAQIESGFSYEKFKIGKINSENTFYNASLLRYGMNKNFEIRLQTDYARFKSDSSDIIGFDPITIGTKLLISENKGIIPQASFLFNLTLPFFGKKDFKPEYLTPSIYLLMQNDVTDKFNICYNIGLEYDGVSAEPAEFAAICFGYNISDNLSVFAENYNWFSNNTKPANFADFGCSYLLTKNIQFDLSGNADMRDFKNYLMFNFGVAWRIMK